MALEEIERPRVPVEREVDRAVLTYRAIVAGKHPTTRRFEELAADLERVVRERNGEQDRRMA